MGLPPIHSAEKPVEAGRRKPPKIVGPLPPLSRPAQPNSSSRSWNKSSRKLSSQMSTLPSLGTTRTESTSRNPFKGLPCTEADLLQKVDFFSIFLSRTNLETTNQNDFCLVHGDSERKEGLFYALKARRAVKLRQLKAVQAEMDYYTRASVAFNEIVDDGVGLQARFDEMLKQFADKSYKLAVLKSQEQHYLERFTLRKNLANLSLDYNQITEMRERIDIERRLISVLDSTVYNESLIKK